MSDIRKKFENWGAAEGWMIDRSGEGYANQAVDDMWYAWKAALKAQQGGLLEDAKLDHAAANAMLHTVNRLIGAMDNMEDEAERIRRQAANMITVALPIIKGATTDQVRKETNVEFPSLYMLSDEQKAELAEIGDSNNEPTVAFTGDGNWCAIEKVRFYSTGDGWKEVDEADVPEDTKELLLTRIEKYRKPTPDHNYAGAMADIDELVRVALTNPAGLDDFIRLNYPKQYAEHGGATPPPPPPKRLLHEGRSLAEERFCPGKLFVKPQPTQEIPDDLYRILSRLFMVWIRGQDMSKEEKALVEFASNWQPFIDRYASALEPSDEAEGS